MEKIDYNKSSSHNALSVVKVCSLESILASHTFSVIVQEVDKKFLFDSKLKKNWKSIRYTISEPKYAIFQIKQFPNSTIIEFHS